MADILLARAGGVLEGAAPARWDRRRLLLGAGGLGALGLAGCATAVGAPAIPPSAIGGRLPIYPIRAQADRLFDITVCLRPFRAAGPRIEAETIGDALVVHNYGHGGSGWSLSWGSGTLAVQMATANSPKRVAVIGCGALGLTSAILAQEAGCEVTIYAKDLLPQTRSARATGSWTPDSRIALADAGSAFEQRWERMARTSFKRYRSYLGLPGDPVEWFDRYEVDDETPRPPRPKVPEPKLEFASLEGRLAGDLTPGGEILPAGSTPFSGTVRRSSSLMFNIADYGHTLMADFRAAGGRIVHREFHAPAELGQLDEKVVINCPGYGARALMKDASITPVRGQIGWLIPQPECRYGVYYHGVNVLCRRDGICVQGVSGGDMRGYGDENETPDRAEAEREVATIAGLFSRFRTG